MTNKQRKIVLCGCGVIGTHFAQLVHQIPGLIGIVLCDPDRFEEHNLKSAHIRAMDLGRSKAEVLSEAVRNRFAGLWVAAYVRALADVPLGILLDADVLVGMVDSKASRQSLCEMAWRTGTPYLDAGVSADGRAIRVTLYVPGKTACVECAFSERDYATLETLYRCQGEQGGAVPATGAPAALGAHAAAVVALELERLFAEWPEPSLAGREIRIYGDQRQLLETALQPNSRCRFDHEVFEIQPIEMDADSLTLGQAFALGEAGASLAVPGIPWVGRLFCENCCGFRVRVAGIKGRPPVAGRLCEACGEVIEPDGSSIHERRRAGEFTSREMRLPLSSFGFERREVFTLRSEEGNETHFTIMN